MVKNFKELQDKMSREARFRSETAAEKMIARYEAALTAYENGGELPHRWPNLCVVPEDDGEFDEACAKD
jgi:hypothetical protein